jgi:hypothetical protein
MPILTVGETKDWKLARDLFSLHENNWEIPGVGSPIGHYIRVNIEPSGQDVLDDGRLVPVFEAVVTSGPCRGMSLQVAEEELETI